MPMYIQCITKKYSYRNDKFQKLALWHSYLYILVQEHCEDVLFINSLIILCFHRWFEIEVAKGLSNSSSFISVTLFSL